MTEVALSIHQGVLGRFHQYLDIYVLGFLWRKAVITTAISHRNVHDI